MLCSGTKLTTTICGMQCTIRGRSNVEVFVLTSEIKKRERVILNGLEGEYLLDLCQA